MCVCMCVCVCVKTSKMFYETHSYIVKYAICFQT